MKNNLLHRSVARYRVMSFIALLAILFVSGSARGADALTDALQKGLLEEQARQDLNAAIEAYQTVLKQFEQDRTVAATALFRLGECYRKQGKLAEANAQFARVVADFSDQTPLAELSRKQLSQAGRPNGAAAGLGGQASAEEVKLLREEIALVEQLLADARKRQETGRASSEEVIQIQRQLFPLKRKLPENADPARQQALIQEEINLVEQLLANMQKQVEAGVISPTEQIPLRRERLSLQRELVAAQNAPRFQTRLQSVVRRSGPGAGEPAAAEGAQSSFQTRLNQIVRGTASDEGASESAQSGFQARLNEIVQRAANQGDEETKEIERLKDILQNSPDLVNDRTRNGMTPLHTAASKGQLAVARFLLDNGAEVNAATQGGTAPVSEERTALQFAAEGGHKAMVELLLDRGAAVDARDKLGRTALYFAIGRGYLAVSKVLIARGADVNMHSGEGGWTPLHRTVQAGSKPSVELLLENKADINAADANGLTPLMTAVVTRRAELVEFLLQRGADIQIRSRDGNTALTLAVQQAPQLAKVLLENGADPNVLAPTARSNRGESIPIPAGQDRPYSGAPIHIAAANDNLALIRLLVKHGAKLDLQDSAGRTALLIAVAANEENLFSELLASGANPNTADLQGSTPLLLAVTGGHLPFVQALLAKGADVNASAKDGSSPLIIALNNGRTELARLLLEKGADPNQKGPLGYRAIHVAAGTHGSPETIQLLIKHKADVDARDAAGNTALHYAALHYAKEIVKVLLENGADPNLANGSGETPLAMMGPQRGPGKQYGWNNFGLAYQIGTIPNRMVAPGHREVAELLEQAAK